MWGAQLSISTHTAGRLIITAYRLKGLYFVEFPWLRNRKSALTYGITEDTAMTADDVRTLSYRAARDAWFKPNIAAYGLIKLFPHF